VIQNDVVYNILAFNGLVFKDVLYLMNIITLASVIKVNAFYRVLALITLCLWMFQNLMIKSTGISNRQVKVSWMV